MAQHAQTPIVTVNKCHQCIGAEVIGIDLSMPMDEATFQTIHKAWLDNLLLIFPNQKIFDDEQIAIAERFVYRPVWATDDVIMWDNRCTMHAVTPYDNATVRRIMHRATIVGDAPVLPA